MKDIIKWTEMRVDIANMTTEEQMEQLHYIKAETKGGRLLWAYSYDPKQTPLMFLEWLRDERITKDMLFYADIFLSRRKHRKGTDPHIATIKFVDDEHVAIIPVENSKINPYKKRHRSEIMQAIFGQ